MNFYLSNLFEKKTVLILPNGKSEFVVDADFSSKFIDLPISTMTSVVVTNLKIRSMKTLLAHFQPEVALQTVPWKSAEWSSFETDEADDDPFLCKTLYVRLGNIQSGILIEKKKNQLFYRNVLDQPSEKFFRNCVELILLVERGKILHVKLSANGRIHITGAKNLLQIVKCVKFLLSFLSKPTKDDDGLYSLKTDIYTSREKIEKVTQTQPRLFAIISIIMINLKYRLPFTINRIVLDSFINRSSCYFSLFEPSYGYTGVNVKMKSTEKVTLPLISVKFVDRDVFITHPLSIEKYKEKFVDLKMFSFKKKEAKIKYNSFLIFQSGSVIQSGQSYSEMNFFFMEFIELIKSSKCALIPENKINPPLKGEEEPDLVKEHS